MTKIAGAFAALMLATVPAMAADMAQRSTYYSAPAAAPGFNWSGFYVGLTAGLASGDLSNSIGLEPSGFVGGLTGGANWQWGNVVFGLETDISYSGVDDGIAGYKWELDWYGTTRARFGYAWDRFMPYLTGGLAYGRGTYKIAGYNDDASHVGWTVGAGVEGAITQNWSAKVEYLYVDLGEKHYGDLPWKNEFDASVLRAGVNYRF
jgi:outer membrane immunogenic protein